MADSDLESDKLSLDVEEGIVLACDADARYRFFRDFVRLADRAASTRQ